MVDGEIKLVWKDVNLSKIDLREVMTNVQKPKVNKIDDKKEKAKEEPFKQINPEIQDEKYKFR